MFSELHYFDVFPKVFLTETEQPVTIRSMQSRDGKVEAGKAYRLYVMEAQKAEENRYPGTGATKNLTVTADDNCDLHFTLNCPREGMYLIDLFDADGKRVMGRLRVYALEHDMKGRYPFRGDLHMHTCRSDGKESPAAVVSNYRGHGYDFTVISDHFRYYPSLEARGLLRIDKKDESDLTDLLVVTGEEVHLPLNPAHFVNFGGKFSINALVTPSKNEEKGGTDPACRSLDGNCPEPMTEEDYQAMIRERAKSVPLEIESERLSFAANEWIYEMCQKAGGLGIFTHPYWLCSSMQLSESYTEFVYRHRPFDAFEVLGGENYYQHNGFQTGFYYEMKAKGYDYPIVGSTDSHGSTENNRNALVCSTVVFAPANKTEALISSIKEKYAIAVDTISQEYRLVGDFRLMKYASFLMENWYPLHDQACKAEGYYLGEYLKGDESAEKVLLAMKGRVPAMMKKYFAL